MKNKKQRLLAVGTLLISASPVIAVVSCSSNEKVVRTAADAIDWGNVRQGASIPGANIHQTPANTINWNQQSTVPSGAESYAGSVNGNGNFGVEGTGGNSYANTGGSYTWTSNDIEFIGGNKVIKLSTLENLKSRNITSFNNNRKVKIDYIQPNFWSFFPGMTVIPSHAFKNAGLKGNIQFPEGITTIGDSAFEDNYISNVRFPSSLRLIDRDAFENNHILNIYLNDGLHTIGEDAFNDNWLTSLIVPGSVQLIHDDAFDDNRLQQITLSRTTNLSDDHGRRESASRFFDDQEDRNNRNIRPSINYV